MSDTPPDGDFARYVEQLSQRSAASVPANRANEKFAASKGSAPHPASDPTTQPSALRKPLSVWAVVRWALMAWVALQVVAVFVPGAGVLTLPLFLAVAGWALYRFKKSSSGDTTDALRRIAEQVAKEFKQRK